MGRGHVARAVRKIVLLLGCATTLSTDTTPPHPFPAPPGASTTSAASVRYERWAITVATPPARPDPVVTPGRLSPTPTPEIATYAYTGMRVIQHVTTTATDGTVAEQTTHYLGEALEIHLPTGDTGTADQVVLHVYAGAARIASRNLGSVATVLAAAPAGTLGPRGANPGSGAPGFSPLPAWEGARGRGRPPGLRRWGMAARSPSSSGCSSRSSRAAGEGSCGGPLSLSLRGALATK